VLHYLSTRLCPGEEARQIEIKQLIGFVTAVECGSINKAAERLYTTQPNISKIIKSLEKELGCNLFERTNHGLVMTPQGQRLFNQAQTVIHDIDVMASVAKERAKEHLGVASYPSNMISRVFTDYYNRHEHGNGESTMELLEGATGTVIEHVERYRCEIGILYAGHKQTGTLSHWLERKKLEFNTIARKAACVYIGPNHPFYGRKTIRVPELSNMKFIQPSRDYLSAENHLYPLEPTLGCIDAISPVITTNSDHATMSFLSNTDLCSLGIFLLDASSRRNDIKALQIEGMGENLNLGYVKHTGAVLSEPANGFIDMLIKFIKNSD
jgi:DNA-binding transcriptional LysR family regulator